jgi:hypothetical protein
MRVVALSASEIFDAKSALKVSGFLTVENFRLQSGGICSRRFDGIADLSPLCR